jgi:tripartite-type tricarboxylate transporter receptor subunit TctC
LLLALGALRRPALAQTPAWPSKPVRISVPVTAGSAIDLVCRTVFDQVSQQVGQPFIIDNRGGGRHARPRGGGQG